MAKHPFLIKDGKKMAIMRPENPMMAIDMARRVQLLSENGMPFAKAEELFSEILRSQPYTYMGLGSRDGKILDEKGWAIGKILPGDSFIDFEDAKKLVDLQREMLPKVKELESMVESLFADAWRSRVQKMPAGPTVVWRTVEDGDLKIILSADLRIGIIMSAKRMGSDGVPQPCEDDQVFSYVRVAREAWEHTMPGYWKLRTPPETFSS